MSIVPTAIWYANFVRSRYLSLERLRCYALTPLFYGDVTAPVPFTTSRRQLQ
jgi:hypothetical protein